MIPSGSVARYTLANPPCRRGERGEGRSQSTFPSMLFNLRLASLGTGDFVGVGSFLPRPPRPGIPPFSLRSPGNSTSRFARKSCLVILALPGSQGLNLSPRSDCISSGSSDMWARRTRFAYGSPCPPRRRLEPPCGGSLLPSESSRRTSPNNSPLCKY